MSQVSIEFPARCSSGIPVFALGVIAIGAGIYQKNPALLALGSVFCSASLLLWFIVRRSGRGIRLRRIAPRAAFEGERVDVALELENGSGQSFFYPQVCDVFAPEIHAQKSIAFSGRLVPDESARQEYVGYCVLPRGKYSFGPAAIRISDPLGWFEKTRLLESDEVLKLYPRIGDYDLEEDLGRCVGAIVSDRHDPRVGLSSEFRSVREYRPGDSPRRVHWGLSARRGEPVVREFSAPSLGERTIFLDVNAAARVGWGRASSLEAAIKIAGAVVRRSLDQGRRTRVVLDREEDAPSIIEGNAPPDLTRFLDLFVELKTRPEAAPLTRVLDRYGPRVPVGGTEVVMLHPYLFEEPSIHGWLATRRRLGSRVIVVLFEGRSIDEEVVRDDKPTAYVVARRLAPLGLETYVIHPGDPLETGLPRWSPASDRPLTGESASGEASLPGAKR